MNYNNTSIIYTTYMQCYDNIHKCSKMCRVAISLCYLYFTDAFCSLDSLVMRTSYWLLYCSMLPLNSVENLPSTLSNLQPSSVRSVTSPAAFYPSGRTPLSLGPLDILQSPGSVLSMPPKSVTGESSTYNNID